MQGLHRAGCSSARLASSALKRRKLFDRSQARPSIVCFVETKGRTSQQVAEPPAQQRLAPSTLEAWEFASALAGPMQLSRQLIPEEFDAWDQDSVWKAFMGAEVAEHKAATITTPPAAEEAGEAASEAHDGLAASIHATRLSIQSIDAQLAHLRSQITCGPPAEWQAVVNALIARVEEGEVELGCLKKGAVAAMRLERRQQDLRWEVFQELQRHAGGEDSMAYRSLLSSLDLERQLVLVLEAKQALQERMGSAKQQQLEQVARMWTGTAQEPPKAAVQPAAVVEAAPAAPPAPTGTPNNNITSFTMTAQLEAATAPLVELPAPAAEPDANAPGAVAAPAPSPGFQLRMVSAGVSIPHPEKAHTGGEDAFFVSAEGLGAAGVADGVGGWSLEGIDPALYPRQLVAVCKEGLSRHEELHEEPLSVLLHAHERAHAPGSCTVCLAAMQGSGLLKVVSLGDCGVAVVRDGEGVVFRAEVQEYEFNYPLQMASPLFMPDGDHPLDAHQYEVQVLPGDVVVMGSDGLFDNLWEEDLRDIVQRHMEGLHGADAATLEHAAHELAAELAQRAHAHSQDPTYPSPFAVERHERTVHPLVRHMTQPAGGKEDDITAVVSVLCF